ncbi:MAG TPA: hypothetical protein VF469_19010 [Kofleriaceae bacterium]
MDVLAGILAAAAVLAGCYAPSVRDCTVRCTSPDDCASGQICGEDRLCAAPEIAGRCRAAPIDAIAAASLHVQIMGEGSVVIDGSGTCSSLGPQRGDCTFAVVLGVAVTAHAVDIQPDQAFKTWTSPTCAGQGARCVFTPVGTTTIAAKFGKNGMHGDLP